MALQTSSKTLIPVKGHGTIKIVPLGGRRYEITAPMSLEIIEKKGRPKTQSRSRRDRRRRAASRPK